MSDLTYDVFFTELGWAGALASSGGLHRLALRGTPQEALEKLGPEVAGAVHDPTALAEVRRQVTAYLKGEQITLLDIRLDLDDSPPFFGAAWEACRRIPAGETRSYRWLADQAGSPRAVRAAGQAMARNPVALVVPCHRVVASDGSLHGYGGGLDQKARLLELERGH